MILALTAIAITRPFAPRESPPQPAGALAMPAPPPPVVRYAEERLKEMAVATLMLQEVDDPALLGEMGDLLDRLLSAMDPRPQVDILVVDSMIVNAFAFPGNLIVVNAGLIRAMDSPQELAAVVAHELGHVIHRDAMKALSREIGLAMLLTLMGGRDVEVLVRRILGEVISQKFSRDVEARADTFAIELLSQTAIDPAALGDALAQLSGRGSAKGIMRYLDSHPDVEVRILAAYEESERRKIVSKPLAEVDWEAIREAL